MTPPNIVNNIIDFCLRTTDMHYDKKSWRFEYNLKVLTDLITCPGILRNSKWWQAIRLNKSTFILVKIDENNTAEIKQAQQ